MSEKKIIPPSLVIATLQLGVTRLDAEIAEVLGELETLWDSYQRAGEHLDRVRERKDQYTQAICLLQ